MFASSLTRIGRAACAAALLIPTILMADDPQTGPRTPESALKPVNRNPARHAQFLDRIKQGPVGLLFLGDSITDFWPRKGADSWAKFAPYHPADFGVSGERTEDLLWRVKNGELDGIHPQVVVLLIGTNNIGHFPDEQPAWVAEGVREVLGVIHEKLPDSQVILLAIFPREARDSVNRKRVDAVNVELAKLEGATTNYLDINHVFLDASGEIPPDVMPDGLHPDAKGYQL